MPDATFWMQRAIEIAEQGRGRVEPNPLVGAVVVKDGKCIGEGFHREFGGAHAEIEALRNCSQSPKGSTVFVSLEPCCHSGKTPPCSQALIEAGIQKVVIGMLDPNPRVQGGGVRDLKAAGIEIESGLLARQVAIQNCGFLKHVTAEKPWVIAKYAMTIDGNIATDQGDSKWISNEDCRKMVHRLRGQVDGIVVGSGTVLADDPALTARPAGPRTATRIVFDSAGRTPSDSMLVRTANQYPTLFIVNPDRCPAETMEHFTAAGIELMKVSGGRVERIDTVLKQLHQRDFTNILLEGGSGLLGEFLDAGALDEVQVYLAPLIIGRGLSPFASQAVDRIEQGTKLETLAWQQVGDNLYYRGLINRDLIDQAVNPAWS